jgi:hypothetical protein
LPVFLLGCGTPKGTGPAKPPGPAGDNPCQVNTYQATPPAGGQARGAAVVAAHIST